jgi:hypothetical protein
MVIKHMTRWEHFLLFFKQGTWHYNTSGCYLYGMYVKEMFGHQYILEESKEKIC